MSSPDPTEHPRPLLRRPWTSLDGEWDFAADPDLKATPGAVAFDARIRVPYAPETPASGVDRSGPLHRVWYGRPLPAPGGDRRTVLHFGAVDRVCDVWVGGAHVARHEGGYTPFAVDVTDHLGDGADVVVRADDDPLDLEAPRGKQEWRDEPHGIWYPRTTGIWRTPWLEHVGPRRIADVQWRGDPRTLRIDVRVELSAPVPGARLHLRLRAGDRLLADDDLRVDGLVAERTLQVGDGGFDDRERLVWEPDAPTLIDAELALVDADGTVLDEVASYTALRSVGVEDGRFLLNGRPVPLRLVLDQGYWPDTGATPPDVAALRRDLELTRALGFTGARKHQKTEDPRYLALADRMGLLVWAEMPSAHRPGPLATARLLREWPDVVAAHRGHPSVVAWVPVNEGWGVQEAEVDPRQRALVRALTATADALDGTRPVSADDGWETRDGAILGVHDYTQDPEVLARRYGTADDVARTVAARRADGRLADLDRAGPSGRAVVLSEFGGVALRSGDDDRAWGYAEARSAEDLLERYRGQWAAVHASTALAGACWTQLTDTYQEVNGLLTADRVPKADLADLRRATEGRA
ncbi:glycoside hydrolase family 2 protein [Geodermatophilus sp. SYSU D00815]